MTTTIAKSKFIIIFYLIHQLAVTKAVANCREIFFFLKYVPDSVAAMAIENANFFNYFLG